MPDQHFVIDGSNIATEGRTSPSFAQLREALSAFRTEHPDATVTLVVDASFEHRIDESEQPAFQRAEAQGELVSPPAGAIGRGDGFLLQIADRTGATVVSNDSFQEFHGQYDWLFHVGRLIGGKPVPGVGWIFSLRSPVRGARSRKAVREAEKAEREPTPKRVTSAIAEATRSVIEGSSPRAGRSRRRRSSGPPPVAVNEPAPFLRFVIDHRPGMPVEGRVVEFASHGAFVDVDGVRCYVPLSAMGDPPPNSAREALSKGATASFVVQAVDAPRRGIELAVPGFEKVAGAPSEETVEAEADATGRAKRRAHRARRPAVAKGAAVPVGADGGAPAKTSAAKGAGEEAAAKKTAAKKATGAGEKTAAKKAAAAKKATGAGEKTAAKKAAGAGEEAAAKKAAAKKAPGRKAPAGKAPPTPAETAPAKRTAAKGATGKTGGGAAPAKKASAKKNAARAATAKAPAKKVPAQKTTVRKTPSRTATGTAPARRRTSADDGR